MGGMAGIAVTNQAKARLLYDLLDDIDGFYRGHAHADDRSLINVTFLLPSVQLEQEFISQAELQGLSSLAGHRSVGGIRASIYNAMPEAGVDVLIQAMQEYKK